MWRSPPPWLWACMVEYTKAHGIILMLARKLALGTDGRCEDDDGAPMWGQVSQPWGQGLELLPAKTLRNVPRRCTKWKPTHHAVDLPGVERPAQHFHDKAAHGVCMADGGG